MATKIQENKVAIEFQNSSNHHRYLHIELDDGRFRVASFGTIWLTQKNVNDLADWLESRIEEIEEIDP